MNYKKTKCLSSIYDSDSIDVVHTIAIVYIKGIKQPKLAGNFTVLRNRNSLYFVSTQNWSICSNNYSNVLVKFHAGYSLGWQFLFFFMLCLIKFFTFHFCYYIKLYP